MYLADEVRGGYSGCRDTDHLGFCGDKPQGSHGKPLCGYNSVEFNDVRLTYFRIKTGDGEYEAIPVYSFAQLDSDHSDTYPIQLVLIDARDGSEVSMVQDEARFLNK